MHSTIGGWPHRPLACGQQNRPLHREWMNHGQRRGMKMISIKRIFATEIWYLNMFDIWRCLWATKSTTPSHKHGTARLQYGQDVQCHRESHWEHARRCAWWSTRHRRPAVFHVFVPVFLRLVSRISSGGVSMITCIYIYTYDINICIWLYMIIYLLICVWTHMYIMRVGGLTHFFNFHPEMGWRSLLSVLALPGFQGEVQALALALGDAMVSNMESLGCVRWVTFFSAGILVEIWDFTKFLDEK